MCYNVKALLRSQLKRARRNGHEADADAIQLQLDFLGKGNYNQVSGFEYAPFAIYPTPDGRPAIAEWGFVPATFKGNGAKEFRTKFNTLNATVERLFDSNAFKSSAESKHCLIYVDGFYEYHHHNGKKYPFFIHRNDAEEFPLAGIWDEWTHPGTKSKLITFSILTTRANRKMSLIHNNPGREGARMPVILDDNMAEEWMKPGFKSNLIEPFAVPFPDHLIAARPVKPLSGKNVIKNDTTASDEIQYEELHSFIKELQDVD